MVASAVEAAVVELVKSFGGGEEERRRAWGMFEAANALAEANGYEIAISLARKRPTEII